MIHTTRSRRGRSAESHHILDEHQLLQRGTLCMHIYIPIWWPGYETGRMNESVSCRLAALLELAAAGLSTGSMQLIASHFLQKKSLS